MIPIVIISGFLGAGKTTFLQHLLEEHGPDDRVLIIENDFGETSLDAMQLQERGAAVREVTAGCICCSLQGNFKNTLLEILNTQNVDTIYIEPSGISKLSEIIHTCEDEEIAKKAYIQGAITIVDSMQAPIGIRNFGSFFKDQISHCDAIFLSHIEDVQQQDLAVSMIQSIAPHTPIYKEPWDTMSLRNYIKRLYHCDETTLHDDNPFISHTFRDLRTLTPDQWVTILKGLPFTVLRAKGIIPTTDGPREVQYTTHHCHITPTTLTDYNLIMIGTEFDIPLIANEICNS